MNNKIITVTLQNRANLSIQNACVRCSNQYVGIVGYGYRADSHTVRIIILYVDIYRIYQSSSATKSHPPTRFYCSPRNRKMGFLYPKSRYLPIFARFSPVIKSNMNRFRNAFHSRIALSKLWNIAAQSSSRHKLRRMKIIIKTFSGDNRFPCVSSVVFEAITISISLDLLARWTEQFGTSLFNRMFVWSCHLFNWCWFVGICYFPSSIFVVESSCTQSHGVDPDFDDSLGLFIFRTSFVWGRVRASTI